MEQRCEVCENFRPSGDLAPLRTLVEVTFGARRVLLCVGHAQIARNSGVSSIQELCALYRESSGERSYVQRRSRSTVQLGGERQSPGRRASDA
jgi:hypothetical protein